MSKLSNPMISVILVVVAGALAITAFVHGGSDASRGQMFTFAGGIVTGAFAFLNGAKDDNEPKK